MQNPKVKSYPLLCHFQSNNYSDTFHSSKNSTLLWIGLISPPECFTPLSQPHLSNIWGTSFVMPFLCQIAISKATPGSQDLLALPLCQNGNLPYTTPYTQYQDQDHLRKCIYLAHAIRVLLNTNLFNHLPCVQLSPNFTHILYIPILAYCEFWGFFSDLQNLYHFIEHLVCSRFSEFLFRPSCKPVETFN